MCSFELPFLNSKNQKFLQTTKPRKSNRCQEQRPIFFRHNSIWFFSAFRPPPTYRISKLILNCTNRIIHSIISLLNQKNKFLIIYLNNLNQCEDIFIVFRLFQYCNIDNYITNFLNKISTTAITLITSASICKLYNKKKNIYYMNYSETVLINSINWKIQKYNNVTIL